MTRDEVVAALRAANPRAKLAHLHLYADAFCEYRAAQAHVAQHGPVVAHPRTGAPIANPYTQIRDRAAKVLGGFPRLVTDALWST